MADRQAYAAGYAVGNVLGGRYQVEFILAQRAASMICLGRDLMQMHPSVVIYSLPDAEFAHRVELIRRLFQDAQIVHVLKRDDLVPILDFNVEPHSGTMFLVLAHRPHVPAEQLAGLAGPESKTAAVFAEMARGLLESHDAQFFGMKEKDTSPGIRLSSLPKRRYGPNTGHNAASRQAHDPVWQEASPDARPAGPARFGNTQITRMHVAVIGLVTVVLAVLVLYVSSDQGGHYGPREVRRGMWQDYGSQHRSYGGRGPTDDTDPRTQGQITVVSTPPGARVYAGVKPLGATPLQLDRPQNRQQLMLRISKPGYIDQTLIVTRASPALLTVLMGKGLGSRAQDPKVTVPKSNLDKMGRLPSYDFGEPEKKPKRSGGPTYDTSVRGDRR